MDWGSVFFSMKGRLSPSHFMKGALVLMGINVLLAMAPAIDPALAMLSFIGLVMIWCWIALWIKRLHDAGSSGWFFLVIVAVYLVVSATISPIVMALMGVEVYQASGGMSDLSSIFKEAAEASAASAVPSAIAGFLSSFIVVFGGNMILKATPGDNQYGPATGSVSEFEEEAGAPTSNDDSSDD